MKKENAPKESDAGQQTTSKSSTLKDTTAFQDEVITRPQATKKVEVEPSLLQRPIEEVSFKAPRVESETHPLGSGAPGPQAGSQQQQGKQPTTGGQQAAGPSTPTHVPGPDDEMKAEQLAEAIMRWYQRAHDFANKKIQISDRQILKLRTEGKLDMQCLVPWGEDFVTMNELITEYNREVQDTLTINPEWRAAILPPLIRIFKKRGIGLSDELMVGLLFVEDISFKTQQFFAMRANTQSLIQFAVEQTERMKGTVVQMPRREQPTPPQPQQPTEPAPVVTMPPGPAAGAPMQDHAMNELAGTGPASSVGIIKHELPAYGDKARSIKKHVARKKAAKKQSKKRA